MILVLFDIDGTLVDMRGAGRRAFVNALKSALDVEDDIAYISFAGATDLDVLRQVGIRHGRTFSEDELNRFFEVLPVELERAAAEEDLVLYPGVRELLVHLDAMPHVFTGLVTGNVESCARVKLAQFGLHGHFMLGAFGHEHADRNEIARLAVQRAHELLDNGGSFERTYLVGDTPADIRAAKTIQATSIAVATGKFEVYALRQEQADHVFDDLSDTNELLKILGV